MLKPRCTRCRAPPPRNRQSSPAVMQGRTGKCVNKHSPRVAGNPAGVGTCTKADTLPLAAWADSLGLSDRLLLRHSLRAAPRVCRLPSTHPSGRISAAPSASPNITPSSSPMMLRHKRRGHPVNLKMGQKTRFVGKYLGDSYSLRIESLVLRLLEAQQANTGYRFTDQAVLSVRSLFASSYSDQDLKPWRIWLQPSSLTKLLLAMSIACPPSNLSPSYAEFIELLLNLAEMPSLPIAIQSQLLEPYVPKDKIRQTSLEPKDAALSALSWPSAGSPESDDSSSRGSATTASDQKRRITVQSLMNMDDSLDDACDLVGLIPLSSSYELSRATTTEAIRVFFDAASMPPVQPVRHLSEMGHLAGLLARYHRGPGTQRHGSVADGPAGHCALLHEVARLDRQGSRRSDTRDCSRILAAGTTVKVYDMRLDPEIL
ncbi:uncharacterized protein BJ171DRAFT_183428 [Polychytrium aggregatum]|uniref:uncharacterized protein n=1 Tax=Polychytrium aggregatum TaxID=110093 RepID=UPI0022FE30AE|nr:uncharacterized protein BJ171DRAFT_183428 [Polychytrium aggregatum]KAI9202350.1 hypothetical protein BJ171DRAFT_183428 [Polychytrium aggregatum]